jgi:putative glutamine amidotransferase
MTRPRIGIVSSYDDKRNWTPMAKVNMTYVDSIIRGGGLPLLLPPTDNAEVIEQYLDQCDGVLFVGGFDIDPRKYGQEPHEQTALLPRLLDDYFFEFFAAVERRPELPMLGVCLGIQLFNVARGGTLHQHLPAVERANPVQHNHPDFWNGKRVWHRVGFQADGRLADLLGRDSMEVNSAHHQAVAELGEGLTATAVADDGVIEAVEDPSRPFLLAVQWHPEETSDRPEHLALFQALAKAAAQRTVISAGD